MDNTKAAIEVLKKALKQHGYTYADVAAHLGLSEASVKKMFAGQHFTLRRFDRICGMMGMDLIDLVRLFDANRQRITHLTLAQEKELVRDSKLLLVALLARNHWSFDDILHRFDLSREELYGLIARLEKVRLLELHPGDRIRMLIDENFRWLAHGPIEQLFKKQLMSQFLADGFDAHHDTHLFLHGALTTNALESLNHKLEMLAHEFSELLKESNARPVHERRGVGLFVAMRQWEPTFMQRHRKDGPAAAADAAAE